jgi:starch phosphorylase
MTSTGQPLSNYADSFDPQGNFCPITIHVEDDRTGMAPDTLRRAFADNLYYIQGKNELTATPFDYYMALAYTVRDRLLHRWIASNTTYMQQDVKTVCYFSAEFLLGRQLGKTMLNLGMYDKAKQVVTEAGLDFNHLLELEPEPGLGNGGLGRLAACFLDSLATLQIPAIGYGIRYEFGIFDQRIEEGAQVERPDKWLRFGNPWEIRHPELTVEVGFGGHIEHSTDERGQPHCTWVPARRILGTPYDVPIAGYNNNTVSTLRLWKASASEEFNFQVFDRGDYTGAVADQILSENISKVLYPNDNTAQGKQLRFEQQYFFVSCSLQDAINRYRRDRRRGLEYLHESIAIQLNDTHPAIAVAELMRLLIDKHSMGWNRAWHVTRQCLAYTNHTLLTEALERWPVNLFERLLPRHLEIIYEINRRFLDEVRLTYPHDEARVGRMSLIQESPERMVRMAHLACVGSHAINGVAALHTDLLQKHVLNDFYTFCPEKFQNKTHGVTPRRWLLLANPRLSELFTEKLGDDRWVTDLDQLRSLEPLADDPEFRHRWAAIKQANKRELAEYLLLYNDLEVDDRAIFDIQVKRIHEYKRQLLDILYVISLYQKLKENPSLDIHPRVFIFAGKAAPGYYLAKLIVRLINGVAEVINDDSTIARRLQVAFVANYSVSLGQRIYPAADLSEQISTAGKEASGTGNMKFALNGALTIGTLDGANIEIREAVGPENFFLFGMTEEEVVKCKAEGYDPMSYYYNDPEIRGVLDAVASGQFGRGDRELYRPLLDALFYRDEYMVLADYQAYAEAQSKVDRSYRDRDWWTKASILNSVRMGKFSSDRTIRDYCREIWNVSPVPVSLENYSQSSAGLKVTPAP